MQRSRVLFLHRTSREAELNPEGEPFKLSKALGVRFCITCDKQISMPDSICFGCNNKAAIIVHWYNSTGKMVEVTGQCDACNIFRYTKIKEEADSTFNRHYAGEMRNEH